MFCIQLLLPVVFLSHIDSLTPTRVLLAGCVLLELLLSYRPCIMCTLCFLIAMAMAITVGFSSYSSAPSDKMVVHLGWRGQLDAMKGHLNVSLQAK
ncbi:hypothetical protein CAOG_009674 [Capsaspora owczarzaki ATCC 30864]|uniref:Vitamin K epoxide reductase domain-containing protein n=1 Tax=Capsaspora owczarzaki (strain ATCC 30864) TaxID=595528 RepID=A0A0D2WPE9_CAPO3|nr:hypothetical protein CAOG_009674 [Capsaspora owczarzaki ATCC 30864]